MAFRTISRVLAVMLLLYPSVAAGQTGALADPQAAPDCLHKRDVPPLSPDAEHVAREIDVLAMLQRVRTLAGDCSSDGTISLEELSLRLQITEGIQAASLDVGDVIAEIGYEQAQVMETRDRLSGAKDAKVNKLTLAGIIIGSGSSAIGNAMGLDNATVRAGLIVQVVGGVGGIFFSIWALRVQGGKASLGMAPNMLAPLLGRQSETSSIYPPDVWAYLNAVPPANPRVKTTWKDELIAEWVKLGRIDQPGSASAQPKIDRLTSEISKPVQLSIDDLTDRNAMLSDVRSRVSLMQRDLRDLTRAISIPAH